MLGIFKNKIANQHAILRKYNIDLPRVGRWWNLCLELLRLGFGKILYGTLHLCIRFYISDGLLSIFAWYIANFVFVWCFPCSDDYVVVVTAILNSERCSSRTETAPFS